MKTGKTSLFPTQQYCEDKRRGSAWVAVVGALETLKRHVGGLFMHTQTLDFKNLSTSSSSSLGNIGVPLVAKNSIDTLCNLVSCELLSRYIKMKKKKRKKDLENT